MILRLEKRINFLEKKINKLRIHTNKTKCIGQLNFIVSKLNKIRSIENLEQINIIRIDVIKLFLKIKSIRKNECFEIIKKRIDFLKKLITNLKITNNEKNKYINDIESIIREVDSRKKIIDFYLKLKQKKKYQTSKINIINKYLVFIKNKIFNLRIYENKIKYENKLKSIQRMFSHKNLTIKEFDKKSILRKKIIHLYLSLKKIKKKDFISYLNKNSIISRELPIYNYFDEINDDLILKEIFQNECFIRFNLFNSSNSFNYDKKKHVYKKGFSLLKNKNILNKQIERFRKEIQFGKNKKYLFLNQLELDKDFYFYFYSITSYQFYLNRLLDFNNFYYKTKPFSSIKGILYNSKNYLKRYRKFTNKEIEDLNKFIKLLKCSDDLINYKLDSEKSELELEDLDLFIDFFIFNKRNGLEDIKIFKILKFLNFDFYNVNINKFLLKVAFLSKKENLVNYFYSKYYGSISFDVNYDFDNDIKLFFKLFELFFEKYEISKKNKLHQQIMETLESKKNHNELYIYSLNNTRKNSKIFLEIDLTKDLETLNKYVGNAKDYFYKIKNEDLIISELLNFTDNKENAFAYLKDLPINFKNKNIFLSDLLFIFDCISLGLTYEYIYKELNKYNEKMQLPIRKNETIKKYHKIISDIILNKKFVESVK